MIHLAVAVILSTASVDHARMAEAIAQIEGGRWGEVGGSGCMGQTAWHQHTSLDYNESRYSGKALPIYHVHLAWLEANLKRRGCPVTPAMLYLCWRRGLRGGIREYRAKGLSDAAVRCQNIYESLSPARLPFEDDHRATQEFHPQGEAVEHQLKDLQRD